MEALQSRPGRRGCSDATLVHDALARHPAAAAAIVERYQGVVRRCLWAPAPSQDVDDLVQEVFVRCFEGLPRLRDPNALKSFVIGITLRVAANDRRRRRRRWRERLTSTGELPDAAIAEDLEARHAFRSTQEILGRFSPENLRVLELRFVYEQELTEIADKMGVSLATAKRHLARASARVRAMAPVLRAFLRA